MLALLLTLLAAQPAVSTSEAILLVQSVSVGPPLEVTAIDLATNQPAVRQVPASAIVMDLGTARPRSPATLRKWDTLIVSSDGQLASLEVGASVHPSIVAQNPRRASELNEMSSGLAFVYKDELGGQKTAPPPTKETGALFLVLEWSLGLPFTVAQEEELRRAAKKDRIDYSTFESLAAVIRHVSAADEPRLRTEVAAKMRSWLAQPTAVAHAIASLATHRHKVFHPGPPPLTEMASSAVAELYSYAHLLARKPDSEPWETDPSDVNAMRAFLRNKWRGFTPEEQRMVAAMPGGWAAMRHQLAFGTDDEQGAARAALLRMAQGPQGLRPGPGTVLRAPRSLTDGQLGELAPLHFIRMQLPSLHLGETRFGRAFSDGIW